MKEILTTNIKKKAFYIALIGVLLVIGGSFAFFSANLIGTKEHIIDLEGIKFTYTEEDQAIVVENAEPMSDEDGMAQEVYFDFNIYAEKTSIDYDIYLKTLNGNTIDNRYIKVYLTDQNNNQIVGPSKISDLASYTNDTNSYLLYETSITAESNGNNRQYYRLRIWLDEAYTKDVSYETSGNVQTGTIGDDTFGFRVNVATGEHLGGSSDVQLDSSNANAPVLASNMIPVIYDSGNSTWVKADSTNKDLTWFNYTDKKWANAVTVTSTNRDTYLNADAGTPILMSDINTMWVWIPRFSATGDTANYNGGTVDAPGAFNIIFVDTNTAAHDAFTFGEEVSGFWMAKFETTGSLSSACTNTSCNVSNVTILPYREPIGYQSVSSFFYISRSMENSGNAYGFDKTIDTTLDTHMLKNSEWGAVAYLTQSIYGRCSSSTSCVEVSFNNFYEDNGIAITGGYDYLENMSESTTGNMYGVYDMNGNLYEYVMGVYWDGSNLWSGLDSSYNSGFNGCLGRSCSSTLETGLAYPNGKYYNLYTTDTNYTTSGLQHALIETKNWYGDGWGFVTGGNPWLMRGGSTDNLYAGLFDFNNGNGNDGDMLGRIGSRFSIIIN